MIIPRRWLPLPILALACLIPRHTSAAEKSDADALAELEQVAREAGIDLDLPKWDVSGFLETGVGYHDNVLLSGRVIDESLGTVVAPDSSAFARAQFNALAWRLPDGGFDWFATIDGTCTRFFSAQTDDAQLLIARTEAHWEPRSPLRLSLAGQYVYDDEVIDTSTTESVVPTPSGEILGGSLQAKFGMLSLEPSARWNFAERWSATLKLIGSSDDFRPPLYDYREFSSELVLARNFGRAGEVGLAWTQFDRRYPDRPQAEVGGRTVDGTRLALAGGAGEARFELKGGTSAKWRLKLKAAYFENRDNYSGWYDYTRRAVQAAWSCEAGAWRVDVDAAWRDYDYRVQTVGFGDPPRRERKEWSAHVRVERDVREHLALFLDVEGDRSRSNDIFLDYHSVVSVVGVRWSR